LTQTSKHHHTQIDPTGACDFAPALGTALSDKGMKQATRRETETAPLFGMPISPLGLNLATLFV